MSETIKEFYKIQGELEKIKGQGEILVELRDIKNIAALQSYIKERTRKCWDESTPLATKLCETNIKIAEEYMKEGEVT